MYARSTGPDMAVILNVWMNDRLINCKTDLSVIFAMENKQPWRLRKWDCVCATTIPFEKYIFIDRL